MTMASTMTMTLPSAASATTSTLPTNEPYCPNCGRSLPSPTSDPHKALLEAQRQIEDLQAQVRLLNQKATAAADRWADYEDELSRLRAASTSTNSTTTTSTKNNSSSNGTNNNRPHTPDPSVSNSPRSSFLGAGASRISQLLSPRKSPTTGPSSTPPPTTTSSNATATPQQQEQQQRGSLSSVSSPALPHDSHAAEARGLMKALAHERRLRAAAEEKLEATNREVEDLSASLFEQANNMVATERRARAALEERLNELGQREEEKKARIGRLEGAVMRIERVRVMLEDQEIEMDGGEEEEDGDGETAEEEIEGEETHTRQERGREKRIGDDGKTEEEEDDKASIRGGGNKEAKQTGGIPQAAD
ncbi:hypothetical protein F5B22DRAFT_343140 [Xylaria bambusicola]|uniref:uncharacterized protein n=1 Tax=Xylaria bambusicola TaxID=326684 RepID=UPI002007E687|nr:uncharacterized protein F5B22DRAFT_343140 [Xylaria bambusicola]KAI0525471.1 hypothetical protein F5B22DRAFT_343140 [Xylaria bambusicola]